MTNHVYVGVDFKTREAAIALIRGKQARVFTVVVDKKMPLAQGFGMIAVGVQAGISETCAVEGWPLPSVAIVEQPSGSVRNLSLAYACGSLMAALDHCYVDTIPSSTWRKKIFGNGNLKTEEAKGMALIYAKQVWNYEGDDDNEAEAICIAAYAQAETTHG